MPIILKNQKNLIPYLVENLNDDLEQGPYGIYQPDRTCCRELVASELDLVIVPGVAFDRQNYRLGRGAGYYDRFLKQLLPQTASFGLAFDFQILESLPHAEHDVPVSRIVSNS